MAAPPPVKSQPLHNFSLPRLKWAHKSSSSSASASSSHQHRLRRRDSPDQRHHHKSSSSTDLGNPSQQSPPDSPRNDGVQGEEDENGEGKLWNLRPRKEATRAAAAAKKNYKKGDGSCNVVKSQRLRGMVEGGQINGGAERKGKRKIWISLSREEIEEDIYALTGGKPSRRPRKWPKNVHKQMDNVFPGSYLAGVSADSYRAMMP